MKTKLALLIIITVLFGLTGCNNIFNSSAASNLLPSCTAQSKNFVVIYSYSKLENSSVIEKGRLNQIKNFTLEAASCKANLTVDAYQDQLNVSTLFSGTPYLSSGTQIGFDTRSHNYVINDVMPQVVQKLNTFTHQVTVDFNSTPLGMFQTISDIAANSSDGETSSNVLVLSDFVEIDQNVNLGSNSALSAKQLFSIAEKGQQVVDLKGSQIVIKGVGITDNTTLSTLSFVNKVRTFAIMACWITQATCQILTNSN